MLTINSNVSALKARTNLQSASNLQSKSITRLSTGLRINQASDDASGLSISEKMRTQIRGLRKANENAQNGISMLQTAEGALNETHSILQRMRELAVQASNGTLTSSDRIEVQKEVDALKDEIDGVSTRTEFNTKKLLTGDATGFASFSSDKMEAVMRGHVQDGEYQMEVDATTGTAQVQATSVFRFKEGVQSVESQDLNATEATATLAISDIDGAGAANEEANVSLTFNVGGEDITVTQNYTSTAAGVVVAQDALGSDLASIVNQNQELNSEIRATYDATTNVLTFESVDSGKEKNDYTVEHSIAYTGTVANGLPSAAITDFAGGTDSETGLSDITNLTNLAASPTEDAQYIVNVDEKGGTATDITGDSLETLNNTAYDYDIYGVIGEHLQEGSSGFRDAYLDYTMTLGGVGAVDLDFNFTGSPGDTYSFSHAAAGNTNADAIVFADAINADEYLSQFIKAEADSTGAGVQIVALNQSMALDFRMEVVDGTGITGANGDQAQFVTGMGKLGADPVTGLEGAFSLGSNSQTGGTALVEFTSDGEIGSGLDAKVSFDGGNNWTFVSDIWNNAGIGGDVTATDGNYSLVFNQDFNNGGVTGTFQTGDRVLIAMNDNQSETNSTHDFTFLGAGAGGANVNITLADTGEVFTIAAVTSGTALDDANALLAQINGTTGIIGSNGTNLRDVMNFTNGSGASATVTVEAFQDFTISLEDDAASVVDNIAANEEGDFYHNYRSADGDLTRVDGFDPTTGLRQNGVVYSFDSNVLDDRSTTVDVAYMDEATGQVTMGSVDLGFSEYETNTDPTDGSATFTSTQNGGGDVYLSTELKDIDRFYDADGNFILGQNGETFSVYNAFGDKADIYIDGGDTLGDVVDKLQDAITSDVSAGGLGMSTGNADMDDNIVSFVTESIPGSTESQQGSLVMRSGKAGANGRLFFSSSEDLKTALGISTISNATENSLEITVTNGLTGEMIGSDVVTDNTLHNVIEGVDIEFDQDYDIQTSYDEATKQFEFSSSPGKKLESVKVVDNSTDFQIGANQGQTLNTNINQIDSHSLRVDRVQVTDQTSAKDAITQIDAAVGMVSSERAKIGAWVNRLEHTMSNLDIQEENQTAAESRIRDLNIAQESTALSKSQMLSQASTSMLAQANQQSQGLLSLLQ